jgi:hypothetical protein
LVVHVDAAGVRFMLTGAIAVGGTLTGIVGEHAGVRAAISPLKVPS